jgi:hypothetical protein
MVLQYFRVDSQVVLFYDSATGEKGHACQTNSGNEALTLCTIHFN